LEQRTSRSAVAIAATAFLVLALPSAATAQTTRVVHSCRGGPGELKVRGPVPGEVFSSHLVPVKLVVHCSSGVAYVVSVDGKTYYGVENHLLGRLHGQVLQPAPANLGRPCCQLGAPGHNFLRLKVSHGMHELTIAPGVQGSTSRPHFDPVAIPFRVGGTRPIPSTGATTWPWVVVALLFIASGTAVLLVTSPQGAAPAAEAAALF
jgi:hypothetical protein